MAPFESEESDARTAVSAASAFNVEELRRRNPIAVGMDVLYLITTGFFTLLAVRGFWPAVIAGIPLAALLYFGWRSSAAFFLSQAIAVAVALALWFTGLSPI